jgi:ketosteroid isomerase-like protein
VGRYGQVVDPTEAVLAVNRRYYDAFEARDLDTMSDLWERSGRALCTHPGWATLEGWGAVAASFFALFQGGQQLQFVLTRERVTVLGDAAWVSLDENLLGDQGGVTVATVNIFARQADDGAWRMVCHHGSVVQAGSPRAQRSDP